MGLSFRIENDREGVLVRVRELRDYFLSLVRRGQDDQALGREFPVELIEIRHFLATRWTPCRPEIQQHDLPTQRIDCVRLPVESFQPDAGLPVDLFPECEKRVRRPDRGFQIRQRKLFVSDQSGKCEVRVVETGCFLKTIG